MGALASDTGRRRQGRAAPSWGTRRDPTDLCRARRSHPTNGGSALQICLFLQPVANFVGFVLVGRFRTQTDTRRTMKTAKVGSRKPFLLWTNRSFTLL